MKKVYLAARFARGREMQVYRERLARLGIETTSRWINAVSFDGEEGAGAAEIMMNPEVYADFARADLQDVEACDTLIMFTGGVRGGRHTEFGYALALGRSLVIIGEREHVFHALPHVHYCRTFYDLIAELTEETQ